MDANVDIYTNPNYVEGSGDVQWRLEIDTGDRTFISEAEDFEDAWKVLIDSVNMWASDEFLADGELSYDMDLEEEDEDEV